MKTLVLLGNPNTGKSQTLIKLAEKYCKILLPRIRAEIIIIIKLKNKTLAISSKGDCTRDIVIGLNKIVKTGCKIDVFVCACHPGNTNGINYLKSKSKQVVLVNKTVSKKASNQMRDNMFDANKLYRMI